MINRVRADQFQTRVRPPPSDSMARWRAPRGTRPAPPLATGVLVPARGTGQREPISAGGCREAQPGAALATGPLTVPLVRLGRPVQGIEIAPRRAARLARRVGPHVCINEGDVLRHAPPVGSTVVSNIPFHLTTPVLRHLLASTSWDNAILVTQWEVARKRAGVGGTTQLTAQWWPWYEFHLDSRIPAQAFRPRSVSRRRDPGHHPPHHTVGPRSRPAALPRLDQTCLHRAGPGPRRHPH